MNANPLGWEDNNIDLNRKIQQLTAVCSLLSDDFFLLDWHVSWNDMKEDFLR